MNEPPRIALLRAQRWVRPALAVAVGALMVFGLVQWQHRAAKQREAAANPFALPDSVGDLQGGPLTAGPDFSRRDYAKAGGNVSVSITRLSLDAGAYEKWVEASESGYPQAKLVVPSWAANGFYDCGGASASNCTLAIQLRSGFHVEMDAEGSATRQDLDAIAAALNLWQAASPHRVEP